jgi:hypothetical protein
MKAILYIIVDVSGSMNEMGKMHLQRNLCRYAAQLQIIDQDRYAYIDIRFYQWASSVSKIVVQSDGDIPTLTAEGSSNLNTLSGFLYQNLNGSENLRGLILSDGNFANSDILNFQKQLNSSPSLILRTVAVGADADLLKLKKISSNDSVYLSENIARAIDSTLFGSDECVTAPESIAQILQTEATEPEEDWDA